MRWLALLIPVALSSAADHSQITVTVTQTGDLAPWAALDCSGARITLAADAPLPACLTLVSPKGARLTIQHRPGAQIAGSSSGTRAVYAKTATSRRGAKLGDLTVGTPSKPIGYFCDPTDTIRSGLTTYARITDPAVAESLRGYTTGCTP